MRKNEILNNKLNTFELKINILNYVLFFLAVSTFGLHIFLSDKVAGAGMKLTQINQKIDEASKYNLFLSFELSKLNSNNAVFAKAQEMGFQRAEMEFVSLPEFASR